MTNKLEEIKEKDKVKKRVKVYLEDVDISAIAMTSGAGACSQMNDPYILKSKDLDLTEEQIEILKKIGEYDKLIELNKEKEDVMPEENKIDKEKVLAKQNEELQKKLDEALELMKAQKEEVQKAKAEKELLKVEKSIESFGLEEDVMKSVSEIMVSLEEDKRDVLVKAFTFLKEFEVKKETEEENELQKKLSQEQGADGDATIVEKSFNEQVNAYRTSK